jgi:protein-L-isoaspartate(D-aspartate) O-methyltransferase
MPVPPTQADLVEALRKGGIQDGRVLEAFGDVPRDAFVPVAAADRAYYDLPIPLPRGQVTSRPSLIAQTLAALSLTGSERVLEVGAGFGFQSALLSRLSSAVFAVEWWPELAERARQNIERHGAANVRVVVGDGSLGLPAAAPFDAVVVAAACTRVPAPLEEQLVVGGRLVQPIGPAILLQERDELTLFVKTAQGLVQRRRLVRTGFTRLLGEHGSPQIHTLTDAGGPLRPRDDQKAPPGQDTTGLEPT